MTKLSHVRKSAIAILIILIVLFESCGPSDPEPLKVRTNLGTITQLSNNAENRSLHSELFHSKNTNKVYYLLYDSYLSEGEYTIQIRSMEMNGAEMLVQQVSLPKVDLRLTWNFAFSNDFEFMAFHAYEQNGNELIGKLYETNLQTGELSVLFESSELLPGSLIYTHNDAEIIMNVTSLTEETINQTQLLNRVNKSISILSQDHTFIAHDSGSETLLFNDNDRVFTADYQGNEQVSFDVENFNENYFFETVIDKNVILVSESFWEEKPSPFGERVKSSEIVRIDLQHKKETYLTKLNVSSASAFTSKNGDVYFLSDYGGQYDESFWYYSTEVELYRLNSSNTLTQLTDLPLGLRVHGFWGDSEDVILFDSHESGTAELYLIKMD